MTNLCASSEHVNYPYVYKPLFFRIWRKEDQDALSRLRDGGGVVFEYDEIQRQLHELISCRYPAKQLSEKEYGVLTGELLGGTEIEKYGVWVYYPWRKALVHLLDELEFIEVRTNRNQYKITREERDELVGKKLGIVGLSVGQSIALTVAMERICGELRLADFDELDLSNMNRIRTGVFNLSVPKVVIAAREIAEIDPYLKVSIFPLGLNAESYNPFFTEGGQLDLLIEVCDSFEVKLESRFKARELKIPVVMDTNDRGMLDVERFDINPDMPIFHGLVDNLTPELVRKLTTEDKLRYLMKIVDANKLSARMKKSIPEIERTILSWPQLASAVVLGGAVTTDVCRRILLNEFTSSGRYYLDIEEHIA